MSAQRASRIPARQPMEIMGGGTAARMRQTAAKKENRRRTPLTLRRGALGGVAPLLLTGEPKRHPRGGSEDTRKRREGQKNTVQLIDSESI